ncbi:hypothetical protein M758_7G133700 [Ceratodon purpureus]|nr:hypothetical protein M758_7G133700 [Ceratodon purpureus]
MEIAMASLYNWRHQLFGVCGLCLVQLNMDATCAGLWSRWILICTQCCHRCLDSKLDVIFILLIIFDKHSPAQSNHQGREQILVGAQYMLF